jgi:hypothetical protein
MNKRTIFLENEKNIYGITIIIILLSSLFFALKFFNYSFKNSTPENIVTYLEYLNGIIIPILTLLNIIIFARLNNAVKKSTENNSWTEKLEELSFTFINSVNDLSSEIIYIAENNKNKSEQINLEELKKEIFKKQFSLRVYAESELFKSCGNRKKYIESSHLIVLKLNAYLGNLNGESDMTEITNTYLTFENELKSFIEIGKNFSDEIYKI